VTSSSLDWYREALRRLITTGLSLVGLFLVSVVRGCICVSVVKGHVSMVSGGGGSMGVAMTSSSLSISIRSGLVVI